MSYPRIKQVVPDLRVIHGSKSYLETKKMKSVSDGEAMIVINTCVANAKTLAHGYVQPPA
jgi:hypothetical protein